MRDINMYFTQTCHSLGDNPQRRNLCLVSFLLRYSALSLKSKTTTTKEKNKTKASQEKKKMKPEQTQWRKSKLDGNGGGLLFLYFANAVRKKLNTTKVVAWNTNMNQFFLEYFVEAHPLNLQGKLEQPPLNNKTKQE